jgi:hypothetical protein
VAGEVGLDDAGEQGLVVAPGLVPLDVGHPQPDQHGADVGALELDGGVLPPGQQGPQGVAVLGLAVSLTEQLLAQHVEVVGDDEGDLGLRPVLPCHVLGPDLLALRDHREAQAAEGVVSPGRGPPHR